MKIVLFWTAVTGWTLALLVHILSIFDIDVERCKIHLHLVVAFRHFCRVGASHLYIKEENKA